MSRLNCEEAQELTAELALGTISGDDRARILTHLAGCPSCRRLVDELASAADALLLLTPEHEPPAGFESEVLARMRSPRVRPRARILAAAAMVALTAVAGIGGTLWATSEERRLGEHYLHALDEADGDYFGVKRLVDPGGAKVGNVFVYTGETDWAFAVFDEDVEPGGYQVDVRMRDAGVVALGTFELTGARRTWGRDVAVDLKEADALRFHTPSGAVLVARLR